MRYFGSFTLFFILILLSNMSFADEGIKTLTSKGYMNQVERKLWANKINNSIIKIDKAVPTLKPKEKEWLETEGHALQDTKVMTPRYANFISSNEYRLNYVKEHSEKIINPLTAIQNNNLPIRQEILLWTVIVYYLNDHEYWQDIQQLINSKVIAANVLEGHQFPYHDYVLLSNSILAKIVIPYLNNDLTN